MLSNVLRVLFIKVTTRQMQKQSLKYQKQYEDELDAYYCARLMMADEIAGNARAFLPILIIFIFIVPTKVNAAGSFSINKSSESLTTGATTTIVISASSCAGRFNISSSNTAVATVSPSSVFLDNSRETITITTKSAGTAVISVVADDVTDTDVNDVVGTKTCTITVSNPTPTQPTQPTQPTKSSNANLRTLGITPNDFT